MQQRQRWLALTTLALVVSASAGWAQEQPSALGIPTLWRDNALWVSIRDAAGTLGFDVQYLPEEQRVEATHEERRATVSVAGGGAWVSADNRLFVPAAWLEQLGYTVRWDSKAGREEVSWEGRTGYLKRQPQSIAVDLSRQLLFAREGDVLVYQFRVSTGKLGYQTPNGNYKVLRKQAMHISTIYPKPTGGAKMPYSLWFTSGYYIHGYRSVPNHPASHGCIRLSIPNAKTLYQWASIGTPVKIYRSSADA